MLTVTGQADETMKMLNDRAIRHYHQQGYHAPSASCRDQAASLCVRLESFEAGARILAGKLRHKSHLQFDWPNDLVRHPRILDAVEDVIGPNIVCWCSSFFIKETRNPRFVSWHQDSTHWGLDPADAVTACRCRRCARGTRGLRRHPHERHSGLPTSTAVGRTVREFPDKPRHEILSEIEWTLSRATPGDLVLIYYSGHGKLDRNGRVCLATLERRRERYRRPPSLPATSPTWSTNPTATTSC
jgi:hypothetical protein